MSEKLSSALSTWIAGESSKNLNLNVNGRTVQGERYHNGYLDNKPRVVLIGAHPDDEVINPIGPVLARRGLSVATVSATYGEKGFGDPYTRAIEYKKATERYADAAVILGHEDGKLENEIDDLTESFEQTLQVYQPDVVLLPSFGDKHKDHVVVAFAATKALHNISVDNEKPSLVIHGDTEDRSLVEGLEPNIWYEISDEDQRTVDSIFLDDYMSQTGPQVPEGQRRAVDAILSGSMENAFGTGYSQLGRGWLNPEFSTENPADRLGKDIFVERELVKV